MQTKKRSTVFALRCGVAFCCAMGMLGYEQVRAQVRAPAQGQAQAPAQPQPQPQPQLQHHPQHQHHTAAAVPASAAPAAPRAAEPTCRNNSFLDAMSLINASVKASTLIGQANRTGAAGKAARAAQAELDSVLGIAIRQAHAEFPCVVGKLEHGYDQSYHTTLRTAYVYGTARRLPPATLAKAQSVMAGLPFSAPSSAVPVASRP